MEKIKSKHYDEEVTHAVIQCGFNDLNHAERANQVVNHTEEAIKLLKGKFSRALILIGEIIPNPTDQEMNNRINATNYVLEQSHMNMKAQVRYVTHQVCRVDHSMFREDGIHLNKDVGTPQLLKDFYHVAERKQPFEEILKKKAYRDDSFLRFHK